MIPRYSRQAMSKIWTLENRFKTMLEVEILACEGMAEIGEIPKEAAKTIREKANFNLERIAEIEAEVHHDVIAFLTSVSEHVGDDARYIHKGLTSSDVIDSAFSIQLREAGTLLLEGLSTLTQALKKRAQEHKNTICIGRSHGIQAEPTTFGLKLGGHYAAFMRHIKHLERAIETISVCTLSGAVGTYATIDPRIEDYICEKLGFKPETYATQIIPRDRHAHFFAVLANIASSLENLAIEIRHLQRTEVREVEEFFSKDQKGSSAMPHKRNPVLSENVTGLARVIRSTVIPAFENVSLWHERDISHSSVERVITPDATIALDFIIHRMSGVIDNLLIYPDRMMDNVNYLRGIIYSQSVLIALTEKGIARDDAYRLVQRNAMQVWEDKSLHFIDLLKQDKDVTLTNEELDILFKPERFLKHLDTIWGRIFND